MNEIKTAEKSQWKSFVVSIDPYREDVKKLPMIGLLSSFLASNGFLMLLEGRKVRRIASLEDKMENVQRLSQKLLSLRVDVVDIARRRNNWSIFIISLEWKWGEAEKQEKIVNENSS